VITTGMFITLVVVDALLLLYAWIDSENRNFTHVWSAVIAMILSWMLGTYMILGLVEEPGEAAWTVVADTPVGYFFIFIGIVALIYAFLSAIEAMHDAALGRDSSILGGDE
jgi:fumarate reductase subunit D